MDTLLLTFLVKEKSVPVWAARAHETKKLMKLSLEEEAKKFYTLLQSFVSLPLRISTSSILHWGSREGGNALSLPEVKEPEGSLCIFAYFLYTRK